jgi:TonB family protein
VILHLLLMNAGSYSFRCGQKHQVEIDITNMVARAPGVPKQEAAPKPAAPAPKPAEKPKEWTKPADNQKVEPATVPTTPVAAEPPALPPEIPLGTGEGGEALVSHLPQLLNLSDLGAILQRFYPQAAREDGREATVVMDIHINREGEITAVEVVQSADADFDAAAVRVARLLRFKPAYVNGQPVAVKMRQAIKFKLEK